jgi:CPA2 family monovalent cation:H+ antiporter-2
MFSIGIEFSLRDLLRVKWVALVGGRSASRCRCCWAPASAGWPAGRVAQGVVVGAVISVASTMVLARLLVDRGELTSAHGRVMIGITLVEDLAVVVLTVLLPSLGSLETSRLLAIGHALLIALVILVPFTYLAFKVRASRR